MYILIDTHILLWSLYNTDKLSENTKRLLEDDNVIKYISLASIWEIEIKHSIGKLDFKGSDVLSDAESGGYKILDIKKEHIYKLSSLELIHRDPFDRLIICQAESEHLHLITSDEKIKEYKKDFVIMN